VVEVIADDPSNKQIGLRLGMRGEEAKGAGAFGVVESPTGTMRNFRLELTLRKEVGVVNHLSRFGSGSIGDRRPQSRPEQSQRTNRNGRGKLGRTVAHYWNPATSECGAMRTYGLAFWVEAAHNRGPAT
jgi:hypothetical protein